jgi:hypothetical protein
MWVPIIYFFWFSVEPMNFSEVKMLMISPRYLPDSEPSLGIMGGIGAGITGMGI